MLSSYRSLREAIRADVAGAIAAATGGALAFAPIEYAITSWSYAGAVRFASRLELAALTATLALVLWLLLAAGLSAGLVALRLVGRSRDAGWRAAIAPINGEPQASLGGAKGSAPINPRAIRPGAPKLWAIAGTALVSLAAVQRAAAWAIAHYKEPQLTAALIAVFAVAWFGVALAAFRALHVVARAGASALSRFGAFNPLGRWRAAGVVLLVILAGGLLAIWKLAPQSRSVLPVRLVISGAVIAVGMALGVRRHVAAPRHLRTRQRARAIAASALVLVATTLLWLGAQLEPKYVAITASPALDKLIGVVRAANDLDRDGFGSLLGEGDCAPLDRRVHPGAIDIPDNGIDENCDGHDFSLRAAALPAPPGPHRPVPSAFRKDWNVLFITVDTLRYDHTTFGGYASGPKKRDTTPNLAKLVQRSTSFAFANAPSAGTMASIPAILTSKFFHSGIALDEHVPRGSPPILMDENVLLPEIMKRKGYATGVVGSHAWWNHWGFEQGVDDYDNSIGKTDDPFRVAADKVTDHVLAWVSRQQGKKWFMWAHYIDPHGRYVAHPDVVDYGASEPDLYDAEIQWTDQELGRLFAELARLPSYERTIIVLTSDHGDSMGEHNVPVGTHGTALYRELQHVPMIFYIPDNRPRVVQGAVTNLDIVPTIAELCDIDVKDLSFEGQSLVPQLFYDGTEQRDRIVFAETNAPQKERAAISERWKLIYYFASNLYELYDLHADPWEHNNLAPSNPPALATMQQALQAWMDRVMFTRDPKFNQAFRQLGDVALTAPPTPEVATAGQAIEGIDIAGIGSDPKKPLVVGGKGDVHVYFHVRTPTAALYKLQLVAWPVDPAAAAAGSATATGSATGASLDASLDASVDAELGRAVRSALRPTADGAFATDRWRAGDWVRERFSLAIPPDWQGRGIAVGLVATTAQGVRWQPTGAKATNDPVVAILGVLPAPGASGSSPAQRP